MSTAPRTGSVTFPGDERGRKRGRGGRRGDERERGTERKRKENKDKGET